MEERPKVGNDVFLDEHNHYITICMVADYSFGEVKVIGPKHFLFHRFVV